MNRLNEIWTAVRKEESEQEDNPYIVFEVNNEGTGEVRIEKRYEGALPLMMTLGGYPSVMAAVLLMMPFPWCFRKAGDRIYIDGPSVGVEGYYPIPQTKEGEV